MRKKLLLAEDSATIQKVFELAFEKSDITVVAIDNGDDAVRMAVETSPDLVVADVTLPGKDGFEVAEAILGEESAKDIPVLILSGTQTLFDEERFRACGAKGVLFKPFETLELLEKVESLIGKREEIPAAGKAPEAPPPADERWDFSDVLDEVEEKGPAAKAEPSKTGEEAFVAELMKAGEKETAEGYDEFDVSIDEIEGRSSRPAESAPPAAPEAPKESEEIEEIEDLEEIEETQEPPREAEVEEETEAEDAPVAEDAPAEPVRDEVFQAELREQFVARAETIFREVAAEAVEKVMWEMMDRLTGEFSAKIRESVEAVAWEVIPATAEALIREEISRIRNQAGKPMSS
jgi:DNA-binding response OmpR family regulator